MAKKIDYNYGFLERWRSKHRVEKEEIMNVIGAHSRNNLDEWLGVSKSQREARDKGREPVKKMLPLQHVLALCNHYGIDLTDFFVQDGRPMGKQAKRGGQSPGDVSLLEVKVDFYEKMEIMRKEYDQRMESAMKTIADQGQLIKEMQEAAIEQQRFIQELQGMISAQHAGRQEITEGGYPSAGSSYKRG